MNRRRSPRRRLLGRLATTVLLIAIIVFFGGPFLWVVVAAFDVAALDSLSWPRWPTLDRFRVLFEERETRRELRNSLGVSLAVMILATTIAALAGFGLSRLRARGTAIAGWLLLALYVMPIAATMVALYDLADRLRFIDTWHGLILVQAALMLPLLVVLAKLFYDDVPRSLDDAAAIDGRPPMRAWWDILSPVARPGLAVIAGLAFLFAWSDALIATVLVTEEERGTLARGFLRQASGAPDSRDVAALGVLYVAPVLALFSLLWTTVIRVVRGPRARSA
jgi:ABC-type glycerol-3-phosphate transport system permease component